MVGGIPAFSSPVSGTASNSGAVTGYALTSGSKSTTEQGSWSAGSNGAYSGSGWTTYNQISSASYGGSGNFTQTINDDTSSGSGGASSGDPTYISGTINTVGGSGSGSGSGSSSGSGSGSGSNVSGLWVSGTVTESGASNSNASYEKDYQMASTGSWVLQDGWGSGDDSVSTSWSYSGSGTYSCPDPSGSGTLSGTTSASGGGSTYSDVPWTSEDGGSAPDLPPALLVAVAVPPPADAAPPVASPVQPSSPASIVYDWAGEAARWKGYRHVSAGADDGGEAGSFAAGAAAAWDSYPEVLGWVNPLTMVSKGVAAGTSWAAGKAAQVAKNQGWDGAAVAAEVVGKLADQGSAMSNAIADPLSIPRGVIGLASHGKQVYDVLVKCGEGEAVSVGLAAANVLAEVTGASDVHKIITKEDALSLEPLTTADQWVSGINAGQKFVSTGMAINGGVGALSRKIRGAPTKSPAPVKKSCFPAGTPVATSEGLRPIETIQSGNLVWAYDLVASNWRLCPVMPYNLMYKGILIIMTVAGETIESTYRHPYWVVRGADLASRPWLEHLEAIPKEATTPGRWVDSCDLRPGDEVLLRDGRIMPLQWVEHRRFEGVVYNMQVEELHCYSVGRNSVLVHNSNSKDNGLGEGNAPNTFRAAANQRLGTFVQELQTAGQRPATAIVAYDVRTGAMVAVTSGEVPAVVAPELAQLAQNAGGLGVRTACGNTIGSCAEFRGANQLLQNGSRLQDIRFTNAVRPRNGQVIPACENCQQIFGSNLAAGD